MIMILSFEHNRLVSTMTPHATAQSFLYGRRRVFSVGTFSSHLSTCSSTTSHCLLFIFTSQGADTRNCAAEIRIPTLTLRLSHEWDWDMQMLFTLSVNSPKHKWCLNLWFVISKFCPRCFQKSVIYKVSEDRVGRMGINILIIFSQLCAADVKLIK